MKRKSVGRRCALLGAAACLAPQWAGAAASFAEALSEGKTTLDIRYRYEHVDQDNALKNADASTVRSRLGYGTGSFYGVHAFLELENVTAIGSQDFNSGTNGRSAYSVVADPVGSQADQAYLVWEAPAATRVTAGRQVINLDNQRFVGRVDWRQMGQTFDALSLVNSSLRDTAITYAYLANVDRVSATSAKMNSNLLNVAYSGWAIGRLSAYAYLLDFDQTPGASTQTYGLRFAGGTPVGAGKALYAAEFAQQSDYGRNPGAYDLNYMLAELGALWSGVTAKLGYEVLEGDGTHSVQTPLATLHAFNGWADQFTATPATGLDDAYVSVGGALGGVGLLAVYHDFKANDGGGDLGSEFDLQVARKIDAHAALLAKYAGYSAGNAPGRVDADKLWLIGELTF